MTQPNNLDPSPAVAQRLVANTALEPLGAQVISLSEVEAAIKIPITNAARQPLGQLHGGISLLLAESVASMHAAFLVDIGEKVPVGIEINGSHLNSAAEGHVVATGRVLRQSRSLIVHQVDVTHVESGKLLCSARVTNFYKPVRR